MRAELGGGDGSCDGIGDLTFGLDGSVNLDVGGGVSFGGGGGGAFGVGGGSVFGLGGTTLAGNVVNSAVAATVPNAPIYRLGTTRERLASGAFGTLTQSNIPFVVAPPAPSAQVPSTGTRSFLVAPSEPMSTGKKVAIAAGGVGALGTVTLLAWLAMR